MPFIGEPTNDELTFVTERLVVRPIGPGDADDAFKLLTDAGLEFLDARFVPTRPEAYAEFAQRIQDRIDNDETYRIYQFSLRLRESDVLVGLMTAELRSSDRLRPKDLPLDVRKLEMTAYVRPCHQHVGYAPEANDAVSEFIEPRFVVNRRIAKIRHDNVDVQRKAADAGGDRLPGQTAQGYETWVIRDDVGN